MTEQELMKKVKENPEYISEIENPSEAVQLAAVQQDGYVIKYIKNPSEAVQLAAVEYEGLTLDYIDNPTENVQFKAVEDDPWNLASIKNPISEVVLNALEADVDILDSIEYWLNDEEIKLDCSSEGLEEGLRKYAIDLLETEELGALYTVCNILLNFNMQKKKETITTPYGNKFEEIIYTSLLEVAIHFLVKFADDYDYFEEVYHYLVNDIYIFENMSKSNGLEMLVKDCESNLFGGAGFVVSITSNYRFAASMLKIDFSDQSVTEHLEATIMGENCEGEVISYCLLEFNGDLFLLTFGYGE